ncbi:DNA primase [Streptomyces sp. NPDC007205]|uniref:DNA primase n=1 Tax=Streptomyces sp. NPDC007205 TaxID=3154316 RepID=UPI0033D2D44C
MNRTALGLALGAGYLLGRTKKLKMALAVGSLAAGKKLNLGPGALAAMARQQLRDNPQFKEIGDQLREDLRGVGKAASGAMVERQMSTLADRLHDRTAQVRDQLSGALPAAGSDEEREEEDGDRGARDESDREEREPSDRDASQAGDRDEQEDKPSARKAAKKSPPKQATAKKAVAKKTAPAKKAAARKTDGDRKTAGKKTAGTRQPKGGEDR